MTGGLRLLRRGERVADAAYPPSAQSLAEGGFVGICRYGSSPPNNPKNLKPSEMPAYKLWRICVIANGEQSETTWQSGYSDANIRLAKVTYDIFKAEGHPDWAPIPFSIDTDARPGDQRVWGAFKAYKDTVPNPLWCYGGSQLIEWLISEGLIVGGWIASALWWSRTPDPVDNVNVFQYKSGLTRFNYYITPLANFRQYNSISFGGSRIDPNDCLRDTAVWDPGAPDDPRPPDPPQPVQEEDMILNPFIIAPGSVQVWYTTDALTRRRIVDPLDLRSTACQIGKLTPGEAWGSGGGTWLNDDQILAKVVTPLGAPEHLQYFGVDVDTFKGGGATPFKGLRIAQVPGDALPL